MKCLTHHFLAMVLVAGIGFGTGSTAHASDRKRLEIEQLTQSALSGDPHAMRELAMAYYYGKGVLKDPFKAKCWIERSREQGLRLEDDQAVERAEKAWNTLSLWQFPGECKDVTPSAQTPRAGETFTEPSTGIAMIWIPGRCFTPGAQGREGPQTGDRQCLKGFWMGRYEVTQAQWRRLMPRNPSRFRGDDLPVEQVSYEDVRDFIRRLNRNAGLHYTLPTPAQWEFACTNRGGRHAFPWGRETVRPQANCGGCDAGKFRGKTAPVGSFAPNRLGLYDMGGNVREWCRDGGRRKASPDRPALGGSFIDNVRQSRCDASKRFIPGTRAYYLGFRLVALPAE